MVNSEITYCVLGALAIRSYSKGENLLAFFLLQV